VSLPAMHIVAARHRLGLASTAAHPPNAGLQATVLRVAKLSAQAAAAAGQR